MEEEQALPLSLGKFSRILVAIDGSEQSLHAARYAIALAKKDGAQLIALMVAQLPSVHYLGPSLVKEWKEHSMMEAIASFGKVKTYANDRSRMSNGIQIQLKTELLESPLSVHLAIVDYADKENVDLIVVGTRGKSGLKKLLLGSVASGVVTYATKPVLVVK